MELLLPAIVRVTPKLNLKAYGFDDFERIARRHSINVKVANHPPDVFGYYSMRKTPKQVSF